MGFKKYVAGGALTAALLIGFSIPGKASQWNIVGSRQQAMGGAGVADTQDSTANYWNPANLAFQPGWGIHLPVTAGGSIENNALTRLSNLLVDYDDLSVVAKGVIKCAPSCSPAQLNGLGPQQVEGIFGLLSDFATFGANGEAVHVEASFGLAGRFKNFGFSAMSLTDGSVFPNTDVTNIRLVEPEAVATFLDKGCPSGCGPAMDQDLVSRIDSSSSIITQPEANDLVYLLERTGADTSDPDIRNLALAIVSDESGPLSANTTGAVATGLSVQEIAFSIALKIPVPFISKMSGGTHDFLENWVHKKFAVSVTPKYMLGITFAKYYPYNDAPSAGDIVTDLGNIDNSTLSSAFGLDVGVAYRPTNWLRLGVMARNVNSPSFKIDSPFNGSGEAILPSSVESQAQVRGGIAVLPFRNLTLAVDADITDNRLIALPEARSRLISIGGEYVIPFHRHFDMALRVGTYSNLSDTVNRDWALTGGLGLRFGSFHIDLSGAGSFVSEEVRTGSTTYQNFPTRLQAGLGLSWEKSL